ncbi:unnamed protein product [Spirodela intermedia]|uniref:Uncharacterized protein n=1 Tax=Spirodela intermedia TaxID=51605 RepID=A0A7I8JH48_SPIIN|nr:unnamed protein product [Spirodela intermedia]CAA6668742.1 unnamed protein product [Spirodela intermedia]
MASLLCSLILLMGSLFLSSAAEAPMYSLCNRERNYTDNSTYQANLASLISSLSSSAPATGFANGTAGEVPDRVYGLAICRGDVDANKCRDCLSRVIQDAAAGCPRNKGATIFYQLCHLRYSDQYFFGSSTGMELSTIVLKNVSDRRFAAASVDFTNFEKIYAYVQCTKDLAPDSCNDCLRNEISAIPQCCNASNGARVFGGSCDIRYGVDPFYNAAAAADPPPPPSPPVPANTSPPPAGTPAEGATGRRDDGVNQDDSLQFGLETLKLATMNFCDQNKLGEGGFGVVYKGVLADGQLIAVKRLVTNSGQGISELKNEVALVAKLQHRNLVRLMGYCLQPQEKLLVYEYLPNKSLDKFLFDPFRSKELTWEMRVKIIEGISRGLLYLHEDSRLKIIHRDLKASNILLDEGMNPKIADFGLARLFGNEQSDGNTNQIAGTYGYMAPEYVMHGQISTKSDVYSFGVLLLEIMTGRRCAGYYGRNPPADLISYIWQHWEEGNAVQLIDKDIADGFSVEEALRRIHIGLLCVQHDPWSVP